MTYEKIIELLKSKKLDATTEGFERAIRDEAVALIEGTTSHGSFVRSPGQRTHSYPRTPNDAAIQAAREYYAEDITNQLSDPLDPTPTRMMGLRRFPVAWAVAEVLRTNGLFESVTIDCQCAHLPPNERNVVTAKHHEIGCPLHR